MLLYYIIYIYIIIIYIYIIIIIYYYYLIIKELVLKIEKLKQNNQSCFFQLIDFF